MMKREVWRVDSMMAPTACSLLGGIPSRGRRQQQPDKRAHQIAAEELESTIMLAEAAMNNERD
jgi:hypothetical protein